jgi:hypothetical protein
MPDRLDPDCIAGKHQACIGEAWDDTNDKPCRCECACHDTYGGS